MHNLHKHHLHKISKMLNLMHHMFHHHGKIWKTQCIHSSEKQDVINNQNAQTFFDLKYTLAKIASALTIQEKGKFSAQPQPNPQIQQNPPTD